MADRSGIGGCADPSLPFGEQNSWTEATTLACSWEGVLQADRSLSMTFSFRIDSEEVGDDGVTTVVDTLDRDPDLSNNSAPIVITVVEGAGGADTTEELAATGTQVGVVAIGGAALLAVGGALLLFARRRRVRFEGTAV